MHRRNRPIFQVVLNHFHCGDWTVCGWSAGGRVREVAKHPTALHGPLTKIYTVQNVSSAEVERPDRRVPPQDVKTKPCSLT